MKGKQSPKCARVKNKSTVSAIKYIIEFSFLEINNSVLFRFSYTLFAEGNEKHLEPSALFHYIILHQLECSIRKIDSFNLVTFLFPINLKKKKTTRRISPEKKEKKIINEEA